MATRKRFLYWVPLFLFVSILSSCGNMILESIGEKSSKPIDSYKVTYHGNDNTGGSVPKDSKYYFKDDYATILGNTGNLIKTGYSFYCWNDSEDLEGYNYSEDDSKYIYDKDLDFYAVWIVSSLDAPTELGYFYRFSHSIQLGWNSVEDADGYNLYASTDGSSWSLIGNPVNNYFLYYGLNTNSTYYFKVSALNVLLEEGYKSSAVSINTLSPSELATAVTRDTAANLTTDSVVDCGFNDPYQTGYDKLWVKRTYASSAYIRRISFFLPSVGNMYIEYNLYKGTTFLETGTLSYDGSEVYWDDYGEGGTYYLELIWYDNFFESGKFTLNSTWVYY